MPTVAFADSDMSERDVKSVRKLTDIHGRYRLTDVQEAENENEEDRDSHLRRNRYHSTSSTASMDTLWDLYPRRLSEAGVSRHSDTVLTEDTDNFIIGQRVWVNGTKPGCIAFIGETQFAPGEWAGIVLDEPIGKNDGSVGGMRYFQCEPKKGIFARLTRLTRVPLEDYYEVGSGDIYKTPSPVNNGSRRSPLSPTGSSRSLMKSPVSMSTSNTSLSSIPNIDFKIGDRVIIKSSQGSKVGTLRYLGPTDFANGEWCGVELDEPRGKNDGSVDGKRYFECRPHFGLFAPVSKVSKSPSKHKPGQCVVHSGTGLPPSGLRREGSKESMTSFTSGASSARRVRLGVTSLSPKKIGPKATSSPLPTRTLQDVLREKQQQIDQLLKERDLERAEITRAAGQADDAEQKLATLRLEYEQYRSQCELKLQEHVSLLSHLKLEKNDLLSQLEDEKRKNEDLQFRFEEETITKGDIEVSNESNLKRIRELEELLDGEKRKVSNLETDSNKLLETEKTLEETKNEVENLKKELHSTRKKREAEENEHAELISSLQLQLSETKSHEEENNRKIQELSEQITVITSEKESFQKEAEEYKTKLTQNEENCKSKDKEIEDLRAELLLAKSSLQEKTTELEKAQSRITELENVSSELSRVRMELSAKTHDLESANENLEKKNEEIGTLKTEIETVKITLEAKSKDFELHQNRSEEIENSLKKDLEQTRQSLKEKIDEIENVKKECAIEITEKNLHLDEANKTIKHSAMEIEKLQSEILNLKNDLEESAQDMHIRHSRNIEDKDAQLKALSLELQQKNEEVTKCSIVTTKLEDDLCTKNSIIEKLRLELDSVKNQHQDQLSSYTASSQKLNEVQMQIGDLQRKLAAAEDRIVELTKEKELKEAEINTLIGSSGEYATKLQQINDEFSTSKKAAENERQELFEKLQNSQRSEQELELRIQQITEEAERSRKEYEARLKTASEVEQLLRQQYETQTSDTGKAKDELQMRMIDMQHQLEEKDLRLKSELDKATENERFLKDQLNRNTAELQSSIELYQKKINELTKEAMDAKQAISQRSEEAIEANAKYQQLLAQTQQAEIELRKNYDETIKKINYELASKDSEIQKLTSETELLRKDCTSHNINLSDRDYQIANLQSQLDQTQKFVSQLEAEKSRLAAQKQEHEATLQEHNQLLEEIAKLNDKLKEHEQLVNELKWERENFVRVMDQLQLSEKQKRTLVEQLEVNANENGEMKKCSNLIELARNIQAIASEEHAQQLLEMQRSLSTLKGTLAEREARIETQRNEILQLQNDLLKAQQALPMQSPAGAGLSGNSSQMCLDGNYRKLEEEKEFAENQVHFLNSIIVEMQKKNQEQQSRIEILEQGYSPSAIQELDLIGLPHKKVIPPRVYCDICEEFDLHDTEDCPKQANSDFPAVVVRDKRGTESKAPPERPYCENCEVFGHSTEDCPEDQTF